MRHALKMLSLLFVTPILTQGAQGSAYEAEIPAYIAPYVRQHDFSGVVLVTGGGVHSYERAFGNTNGGDRFAVGSITKTFTAAAIELLASRGRLNYKDTLDKYVPEYRHASDVTIDELLNHSAGIPDFYSLPAFAEVRTRNLSLSEIAKWLNPFPLDFTPGTKGRYSNSGYSLLALVVERASGQSYQKFLAHNIFGPLRLNATSSDTSGSAKGLAKGYDPGPGPSYIRPAAIIAPGWLVGNGSIRSTAPDLSKWLDVAAAGTFINSRSLPYPFGWSKQAGSTLLDQDGRIPGYAADISIDERSGLKVIVLGNIQCACVSTIAADVRKAAGGGTLVPPAVRPSYFPAPGELDAFTGKYSLPSLPLLVFKHNQGLWLTNENDGMELPLDPISPSKFFFRPLYVYVTFGSVAGGVAKNMNWNGQFVIPRV